MWTPFGAAAFVLALFAVYRSLRNDSRTDKRLDVAIGRQDEDREHLRRVERRLVRYQQRVYQLEAILRSRGMSVPAWTLTPDDIDELGDGDPDPNYLGGFA